MKDWFLCKGSSFRLRSTMTTFVTVMSSRVDRLHSSRCHSFFWGKHFKPTSTVSFFFSFLSLWGSFPSSILPLLLLLPSFTLLTLYYLKPSFLSHNKKNTSVLMEKPAVPQFAFEDLNFYCRSWKPEMYSCLLSFASHKLRWRLGSGCRFIWGQRRSGKTALLLLLTYWDGVFPETTTEGTS